MILDSLTNHSRYTGLHQGFKDAFEFLTNHPLEALKNGKHIINGDEIFALGMALDGKGMENATFETHRKYIDIQFTVSGVDLIGWDEKTNCIPDQKGYDAEKDVEFYVNRPEFYIPVSSGRFAVFFPEDAHAPLGTDGFIHKVVVKIAANWK